VKENAKKVVLWIHEMDETVGCKLKLKSVEYVLGCTGGVCLMEKLLKKFQI
jgi:hypothetical protein